MNFLYRHVLGWLLVTLVFGCLYSFVATGSHGDSGQYLHGCNFVEDDIETGVFIVGRGGFPNSDGIVQLDAAIMDGEGCQFGGVAGLEGVATPIAVAHKVMTDCKHNFLVGTGAQQFARDQGFTLEPNENLLLPKSQCPENVSSHDTLAVIAVDENRHIAAGVSSSGIMYKHPGRVGDSALPGSGLYADNKSGAACCTGDGDTLLRFCPSFLAVEMMHQGMVPEKACTEVVRRVSQGVGIEYLEMGIIAMNIKGEHGASGTVKSWTDIKTKKVYSGFPYTWSRCSDGLVSGEILVAPCIT